MKNNDNELIVALNRVFKGNYFKFEWLVQEKEETYIVILQCIYLPTHEIVCKTETLNKKGEGNPYEILNNFNTQLLAAIMYSVETNGKITNMNGDIIRSFADIKKEILSKSDNGK